MPNFRDILPMPPWEGPPVPRALMDKCPVCGETSRYLFMGTDEELEHWAYELGVSKEVACKAVTCPRCGTVYYDSKILKLGGIVKRIPFYGETLLDKIRRILYGE